jgi:hypothetical protein
MASFNTVSRRLWLMRKLHRSFWTRRVRLRQLDFDHQNLNVLTVFATLVPTTENLGAVIFNILKQSFQAAYLEKVRIEETMMNSFEYQGEDNDQERQGD